MNSKRKVLVGAAAALAVGGTGAGIAATRTSSPSDASKAVISDAARQLGVQPLELSNALKKALKDHVDAEVAAGRLSKAEGDALKKRIDAEGVPLVAPPLFGFGFGHHRGELGHFGFPGLSTVASYLGLSESQLRSQLESGKTLAQIAKDQGRSADGLVTALKDALKSRLDQAVSAGHLTKAQEQKILTAADQRISDFVHGKLRPPRPEQGWFGPRRPGFDRPGFRFDHGGRPPVFPDAA